jgi:hypothetical protein
MRISIGPFIVSSSLALCLASGCGGGSNEPGGGGSGPGFTAKVDGQGWAAEPIGVTALAGGVPGGIVITGSQNANGMTRSLSISLNDITGPGTYALGVGPGVYGGWASVGEGTGGGNANVWETPLNGVAGSITITTLDAAHIVATIAFTTVPGRHNALGGMRVVTDGRIDLPLRGKLPPVAENQGSKVSATLNGKPYNAWSVSAVLQGISGTGGLMLSTTTADNTLSILLDGVTAPGTFMLHNAQPTYTIVAGKNGSASDCCWGGSTGPDVGTVVITSYSPARVKGTFNATLQPQPGKPATMPLVITDGVFDVGTAL